MPDPDDQLRRNDWSTPPEHRDGAWYPKRGPLTRLFAWLILIMIAAGILVMLIMIVQQ